MAACFTYLMTISLANCRNLFPHSRDQIYLNHAAISPFSTRVVDSLNTFIQQRHLTEIENYFSFQPIVEQTRQYLANLLHTHPERIAFSPNTSSGLNLLAGLPWKKGDRILLNRLEFPSNVYPFENLRSRGVEIDYVQPRQNYLDLNDFEAAFTPQTRLVSVSQVQFLTGQRIDLQHLAKLCKAHHAWLSVDGIQALGATDLDVVTTGVDFVACGGHKWLMGPTGNGFIYISEALQHQLRPLATGWLSVLNEWDLLDYDLSLRPDARRFETGTLNFMGIAGLNAALKTFAEIGIKTIEHQILSLTDYLHQACRELGLSVLTPAAASERLGIVTVQLASDKAQHFYQQLRQAQIETSLRENRYLRFSPHFYNTHVELEHLIDSLKRLLSGSTQV
jgi:cysteine desulfurase/selenocysteine lyase